MFWLFLLGSILGWILEGIFTLLVDGEFINHSALVIGPFDICYGICACALTSLLYKYKDKGIPYLFLISFFLGSVLEFVLGFSAWDYSGMFLNVNGRVCFVMSCLWGILGIVWIHYIYPYMEKVIHKISKKAGKKWIILVCIFLLFDLALTISAIVRARDWEKGIQPRNAYEKFLDSTFNKDYLYNMFNNSWSE